MTGTGSIVVAQPEVPRHLLLLFHGVGASPGDLVPLGQVLARAMPEALVASIAAPNPSDFGTGLQWFSVQGVTESNRPARVAQAMPFFQRTVRDWQAETGLGVATTTLIGFSQGAIMALESARASPAVAARVVALSGRFATAVERAQAGTMFHLIHGAQDGVVPTEHSVHAATQLQRLGFDTTLDVVPALAHGIDARVAALVTGYLTHPAGRSVPHANGEYYSRQ